MINKHLVGLMVAGSLLWPTSVSAELRRIELKTIGMD
jgi:hypothetical protein